jgi:hypothetical protein
MMQRLSPYTNLPEGTKLYTHPASSAPDEEYLRALQDACDIIQGDANTEQNYGSLCRIGSVLAKLKAAPAKGGSRAHDCQLSRAMDGTCFSYESKQESEQ